MGQYYRIFMCESDGSSPRVHCSYDYDTGAKLMEHSYYGDSFVEAALSQLVSNKSPLRVWWVGDYATEDDIPDDKKKYKPFEIAWGCDDANNSHLITHHGTFDSEAQLYLINLDTHEYIDLLKVYEQNKVPGWGGSIHPLPLLTAVGNGRGGGDYHGSSAINQNMVGAWAGDLLQIVDTIPQDESLMYIDISSDVHFRE